MTEPQSDSLDLLLSRHSTDHLQEPAPTGAMLETILSAAMRAPDHGRLRPWRMAVVQGDCRHKLAELIVSSMKRMDPEVPEMKIQKRFSRFSSMPMTIVLGRHLRPDNKIPLEEQEWAVGAAAMNILNALHMTGFGGVWVSGDIIFDPVLASELGFPAPHGLAGFIFVGTPAPDQQALRRADVKDYSAEWTGAPCIFGADRK